MLQNEAGRVSRTMKLNDFPLYPLKFKTHVVLRDAGLKDYLAL